MSPEHRVALFLLSVGVAMTLAAAVAFVADVLL